MDGLDGDRPGGFVSDALATHAVTPAPPRDPDGLGCARPIRFGIAPCGGRQSGLDELTALCAKTTEAESPKQATAAE
jgi:hypothetical protein